MAEKAFWSCLFFLVSFLYARISWESSLVKHFLDPLLLIIELFRISLRGSLTVFV